MKKNVLFIAAAVMLTACSGNKSVAPGDGAKIPVKVIFETDMGNDVDDALAYDMLMKYMEQGDIELLGVSSNRSDTSSVQYIDVLNTWYGHPEIPVGHVTDGVLSHDAVAYDQAVLDLNAPDGTPLFARTHASDGTIKPSVTLYRELLAAQPDTSVTVLSVGFSTNLAALLASQPDSISPLSGRDLVAQKVARLVTMAGNMTDTTFCEYNIIRDVPAAKTVFEQWPTEIVTSPFELGINVLYPGSSIENDFAWAQPAHPVVEAYKAYLPMPYDRPTWDLTALLYAVEGPEGYFAVSEPGRISVDDKGATTFTPSPDGNRRYLMADSTQMANIVKRFVEFIPAAPERYAPTK